MTPTDFSSSIGALLLLSWAALTGTSLPSQEPASELVGLAMAADPGLAPSGANHLVSSASVIQQIECQATSNGSISPPAKDISVGTIMGAYVTFDSGGTEVLRLARKPSRVLVGGRLLAENTEGASFTWRELEEGGVLTSNRANGNRVFILE
jgi:hypothetical protein